MRRFLVVGCGGSGGATLAYMMDQLRSELSGYGLGLPAGWQFVHLDVPIAEEAGPDGIGNVQEQGGIYVGCGTQGASYAPLDTTVTSRPRILDEIGTWIPAEPQSVTVPINVGAGQFRAIGRTIVLSRAVELQQKLSQAWANLSRIETLQELADIERAIVGTPRAEIQAPPPVILVVSSMAGGSGASMALDVCRLLTQIPVTGSIGMFMYSADVFDSLSPDARTGVRGNSLAMAGEIIAAQSGASRAHDQAVLRALGLNAGEGVTPPFARVFPVSRQVGLERTPFGDGSQRTVYRALGRGLAGLMTSESASEAFVAYDLGNTGQLAAKNDAFGWGLEGTGWDPMPWGSFGYASLSTGRERFAEYAAQRIARGSVDRIMRGHLTPGSTTSSVEQLKALLDSQWDSTCRAVGMPLNAQEFLPWLTSQVFGDSGSEAQAIVQNDVAPYLSPPSGQNGQGFISTVRGQLSAQRGRLTASAEAAAYRRAFVWHQEFASAIARAVSTAIARHGLAYGVALIDRIETHLRELIVPRSADGTRLGPPDVSAVPADTERAVGAIHGVIANGHQIMSTLIDSMLQPVRNSLLATGCGLVGQAAQAVVGEVLAPLRSALMDSLSYLELATASPVSDVGLAHLQTDHYAAWPADEDQQVSARFMHALNEILLIKSSDFRAEFERQLTASVDREPQPGSGYSAAPSLLDQSALFDSSRQIVTGQVIAGDWPTTGGVLPPRNLLTQTAPWRTRIFGRDPETGQTSVPQAARFQVQARPADLLDRARAYVKRPGESFSNFAKVSLRELVDASLASDADRTLQHNEIVTAFTEALGRARPMMSVNKEAVNRVHAPGAARYRYKFSEVPFADLPVAQDLASRLTGNADIDDESSEIFRRALRGVDSTVSRIDIFGSYANLSPIVFDAILTPASDEWAATPAPGRLSYWRWRRTRPLAAALPLSDIERRAMIAGWFVGQIVGEVRFPAPPFDEHTGPAEVWDSENARWISFPNPLLTPPRRFKAEYDWLPAVLESSLLAFAAGSIAPMFSSLRPYQLLRGVFDDSADSPTPLGALTQVAGERRLITWLRTGRTQSGEPSKIPGAADASTSQARADATVEWLEAVNGLAGKEYCAPGDNQAPGGGMFSTIGTRRQASNTPLFRDIAPDVFTVTTDLRNVVQQALVRALSSGLPAPSDTGSTEDPGYRPPNIGVSF